MILIIRYTQKLTVILIMKQITSLNRLKIMNLQKVAIVLFLKKVIHLKILMKFYTSKLYIRMKFGLLTLNILGLFIGISLLSFVEMAEILIKIASILIKKRNLTKSDSYDIKF